jgi:DNA polymerase III subunit epsilon
MREIVINTETIRFDPIEITWSTLGRELVNSSPTGQTFHRYRCPQPDMPADAVAVHGLTAEFLADKPLFAAIADEPLAFVGDAPLVVRNAGFDIAFLGGAKALIARPRPLI